MQEISQAVPQTSPDVPPAPQIKNSLLVIMAVTLLFATSLAGLFYFQTQKLSKELASLQTQPSPTPTASQAPNGDLANWKTYTNKQYSFELKHPEEFQELQDEGGWPNATIIISRPNRQSYDLPIEIWNSKADYETKYNIPNYINNLKAFSIKNGKYLTLFNTNGDSDVDQILSTFKFLEATPSASPTP